MPKLYLHQEYPSGFNTKKASVLMEQEKLVDGLRNRQEWAFVYLYDHYAPTLLGLLLKMVKDQPQAEDLTQDSLIKVFRSIHQYNPAKGRFSTWLLRITRNNALDYIYRRCQTCSIDIESHQMHGIDYRYWFTPTYCEYSLEEVVSSSLREKYRVIIDLIYFQGYTHEEVAGYLQIPLGTVKTRVRMGLQLLKLILG